MTREMKDIVDDLNATVGSFTQKLKQFSDEDLRAKPRPGKWSRIEVIGHLIDSAHSNLRRFVTGQYESAPPHITYEQEFWVNANDYQHAPAESIISLWGLMNQRVAAVLTQMPESNYAKNCDTGHEAESLHTLQWLAADYVRHMKHHLNQVIPNSYNIVYP